MHFFNIVFVRHKEKYCERLEDLDDPFEGAIRDPHWAIAPMKKKKKNIHEYY